MSALPISHMTVDEYVEAESHIPLPVALMKVDEYFELEERSPLKHECYQGEVLAMSGGSYAHARISSNLLISIGRRLLGTGCTPLSSDMRLAIHAAGMYVYPDLQVVCQEPQLEGKATLLNPTFIAEVLSPSTRKYDLGLKALYFRKIRSVREYMFVEQDRRLVYLYTRQDNNSWLLTEFTSGEIPLALGFNLPVDEIYADVDFAIGAES